jgi:hypothetical protein
MKENVPADNDDGAEDGSSEPYDRYPELRIADYSFRDLPR